MTLHDPAHLLSHAAWLRRLASRLVDDTATADDLVQETYAAALRRPPSADRPMKPWLSRVLRNAARFRWRSETNRSAREAAVASVAERETLTTAELLERHETQQLLARLVGELEEPYREAILLRFAEGLASKDIARRLGIPDGTARWRISEGLARLRARLDALHDGDRKAWLAALAPFVSRAPGAGVPVAIVAALVAIAAIVLVLAVRRHAEHRDVPSVAGPTPAAASAARAARATSPAPDWRAQRDAPHRRIAGRVLADGAPAPGVLVTLTSDAPAVRAGAVRTDRAGRFDFGATDPVELTIAASAPGKVAAIVHVDPRDPRTRTEELEIALTPCVASLWGHVRDTEGAPIAGARVLREDVIGAESDATGAYDVCALPTATELRGLLLVVRADGYGAIHALPAPKGRVQRDFVLTPEATVTGRVVTEAGAPVANARVTISSDDDGTQAYDDIPAPVVVMTDATGAFQASGLRGGRLLASAISPDAVAPPAHVVVAPGEVQAVTLRVRAAGTVRGHVRVDGRAAVGARVSVRGVPELVAVAQDDGAFVISRVPAGHVALEISGYRARAPIELDVRAGTEATTEIAVAALVTMRGTVRRSGVAVPHARIHMYGPSKLGATADASGAYVLAGLEPGHYHLHSDDTRLGAYLDTSFDLPDVAEHIRDIEVTAGATVRGVVVDASGAPMAGAFIALTLHAPTAPTLPMGDLGECVSGADGRFVCGEMGGGGTYTAEVFAGETMRIPLRFAVPPPALELRDAAAVVDGVRLVVERSDLAISGTVADLAGAPIADASVQLYVDRDVHRWAALPQAITTATGAFRITGLAAGTYTIAVLTQDGIRHERPGVTAGTTVAIAMDRSTCGGDEAVRDRTRTEPPAIASRPAARVVWDDRIELVGWTTPATVPAGKDIELAVVYKVLQPLDRSWKAFVHLDGPVRINGDHVPLEGRCPTTTWRPGDYLIDRVTMIATTAGRYDINIGFFRGRAPNWTNLPISAASAAIRDSWGQLRMAPIVVVAPD